MNKMKNRFGSSYWIKMAERCYYWHQYELCHCWNKNGPSMRWEKLMYFYLFKHYGYED